MRRFGIVVAAAALVAVPGLSADKKDKAGKATEGMVTRGDLEIVELRRARRHKAPQGRPAAAPIRTRC